jgi:hypothetical protein
MTVIAVPRPSGWRVIEARVDGEALEGRGLSRRLRVIWSDHRELDGQVWRHVSVSSRQAPLPTWEELEWVRRQFIGDRWAYQVHAPTGDHVNIHPGVLHLWAPHDGPVLPDFTHGGRSI